MPSFKHLTTTLLLTATAVQAQTGFYVAKTVLSSSLPGPIGDAGLQRYVFPGFWNCDDLSHSGAVNERKDVSGDKKGVRIKWSDGDESNWGARDPVEVEINNWDFHVTWYSGTGQMYDLEDRHKGSCTIDYSKVGEECKLDLGSAEYWSLLKCVWA